MTRDWTASTGTVLAEVGEIRESTREGVLATVVDVEGNAYRRPGAKAVLTEDSEGVGAVTAGCLETELLELARDVIADGGPRLETFDLTGDGEVWGRGVGCNGIVTLLLEPIGPEHDPLVAAGESGESIAAVTVLDSGDGDLNRWQRAYYTPESGLSAASGSVPEWFELAIGDHAARLAEAGRAGRLDLERPDGTVSVCIDGIAPRPTLVVVGTGHDVRPVLELGSEAGFRTVAVGYRDMSPPPGELPGATEGVITSPGDVTGAVDVDGDTYAVVMTHNFVDDWLTVEGLVDAGLPYVGLLGPRERFERMLAEFDPDPATRRRLDTVYTPAGLDLGGGSPRQIALGIVGEALAVHNGRDPGHLRDRDGPVHDRIDLDR